jgi:nickel transport protein
VKNKTVRAALILALSLSAASAWAHKVTLFAWPENGEIMVETKFAGGSVAKDSPVIVLDEKGSQILSGKTDAKGLWSFRIPESVAPQTLTLRLDAGEGHQAQWKIPAKDFPKRAGSAPAAAPAPAAKAADAPATPFEAADPAEAKAKIVCDAYREKQLQEARDAERARIEREVVAPLRKELAEAQVKEPGIIEILGGIGWIFGLFSTLGYWRLKRRTEKK